MSMNQQQQQQQYQQVTTVTNRIYSNSYSYQSSSSPNRHNNVFIPARGPVNQTQPSMYMNNARQSWPMQNGSNVVGQQFFSSSSNSYYNPTIDNQQPPFTSANVNNYYGSRPYGSYGPMQVAQHPYQNRFPETMNRPNISYHSPVQSIHTMMPRNRTQLHQQQLNLQPNPLQYNSRMLRIENRYPRGQFIEQQVRVWPMMNIDRNIVQRENFYKFGNNVHLRQMFNVPSQTIDENIVERTKPVIRKIRKITNIGSIDMKKILMSLESGLLAETTWALDCLHIMSSNGHLQLRPNLSSRLVEYYKCFLDAIFDDLFVDTEIDYQLKMMPNDDGDNDKSNINHSLMLKSKKLIDTNDRIYLLDSTNYTFRSRNGLPVKLKEDVDLNENFLNQLEQDWLDVFCDHQYLQNGNTKSTAHIIRTMNPTHEIVPFIRPIIDKQQEVGNSVKQNTCFLSKKRKHELDDDDDEAETFGMISTLCPRLESYESMLKRCLCISSIIRNASFSITNSRLMAYDASLLLVMARLLSYNHKHGEKKTFRMVWNAANNPNNKDKKDKENENELCFDDFSFETLHMIRMNTLVTLSNLSEHLDLCQYSDKIILPLLDGLLHWVVCQSSYARDPLPPDNLSCNIQALEIIAKLSIHQSNIDLILATPPFDRIEKMYQVLVESISRIDDQVLQELSLVVLAHFSNGDVLSARIILHVDLVINNLLLFIEQNEFHNRINGICPARIATVQQQQHPDSNNYIVLLAARTLRALASACEPQDSYLFFKYETRFVDLIMSIFLDTNISQILADLMFILSNGKSVFHSK
ncbi:AT-rich interactive domain-containing protein 1A-like [Dermatophagoides pteronyssinus]|uniref:AT-rich interactive domain-containing protein 1A-like n=1 Tax=Dermatophagoides pteronyssinus TaxID=6956 RepID=UPI003F665A64